jgi:Zn-dependent M28 family amino/carboxypeptidase
MAATIGAGLGVPALMVLSVVELSTPSAEWAWFGSVVGALSGMALVGLAAMTSGNASPGGVDNAGSLAIVLELASRLGASSTDLELVVLFTGAEEDHMVGAMRFLDAHCDELLRCPTTCLNFDGAGSPGRTVLITRFGRGRRFAPGLEKTAVEIAHGLDLPIRRILMAPAVGIDAIPFANRGIECLSLSSGSLGRATYSVHSAGDSADNLDPATLERVTDYAEALIRKLTD